MDPLAMMMGMGGGLMNGLFSLFGQNWSNQFNMSQIQQMENFQQEMSSTAYQRQARDMQLAGINPIIGFGHGASAPSGGAASMGNPMQSMGDIISPAMSSAMAKARLDQELKNNAMGDIEQVQRINSAAASQALSAAHTTKILTEARAEAPEAVRGDIDAAVMHNSAMSKIRAAGTAAEESGRVVGAAKDMINPFISTAKRVRFFNDPYSAQ